MTGLSSDFPPASTAEDHGSDRDAYRDTDHDGHRDADRDVVSDPDRVLDQTGPDRTRPDQTRRESLTPAPATTTAVPDEGQVVVGQAVQAMRDRGIGNPDELLQFASPGRILASCTWWDTQKSAGAGVLAKVIRQGGMNPLPPPRQSLLDEQKAYADSITSWLAEHLPEVCEPDPELVELEREVYGDQLADRRAADRSPAPAAFAAILRLHSRYGRDCDLSQHVDGIRMAAARAGADALSHYRRLRERQVAQIEVWA